MVKIRTVIPPNAKPGTSVIQVVNPKTNKPTRIRVPSNAQPGQVIELELPEDPSKSITSGSNKLGTIPPPRTLKLDDSNLGSVSNHSKSSSLTIPTKGSAEGAETFVKLPNASASVKIPPRQHSIEKNGSESKPFERAPLVSTNRGDPDDSLEAEKHGWCYSCITFRFCGSLCS